MNNNKTTIQADVLGNVIGISENNPEYGYIRVEQLAKTIDEQGWFKTSKRSALIKGKVAELSAENFKVGDVLPGNLYVKEAIVPFNDSNEERELKRAGETGVICKIGGNPIYRTVIYSEDPNQHDVLINHDNGDEIREAQALYKAEAMKESEKVDF